MNEKPKPIPDSPVHPSSFIAHRLDGWPERLAGYLDDSAHRCFKWGRFDCCLFVCGAIAAMTGEDPAKPLRGIYQDRKGARELLVTATGRKTFDAAIRVLAAEFGFEPIRPAMASRGDIVILKDDGGRKALGIVDMDGRFVVGATEQGLVRLPRARALKAWRV